MIFENEEQNENDHRDNADRLDLPVQIRIAPSCTADEISRIRSFPDGERITFATRKNANASPITAHTIDNGTPELRIVRPKKMLMNVPAESWGL